ncbi:hypothetical protein Dfulv_30815 [Dactylosporangium fulvum]|uniref:Uncharacterized protein n=1 Tax=Dactylosporangium fulvum TaxID=53359 RepID=A0ABY5VRV8_9ACTN|nr:hypothetical protein [Dactylosporangium fulvum]UWP79546.1 hypothetical protein Dfulv_30815 [Dactylosporangium fulvum]
MLLVLLAAGAAAVLVVGQVLLSDVLGLATLRRPGTVLQQVAAALAAAGAVVAALPVVWWRTVEHLRDAAGLVLTGAVLGALAVARQPRLGAGTAAHLGLLFLLGGVSALFGEVYFYAGIVAAVVPRRAARTPVDRR